MTPLLSNTSALTRMAVLGSRMHRARDALSRTSGALAVSVSAATPTALVERIRVLESALAEQAASAEGLRRNAKRDILSERSGRRQMAAAIRWYALANKLRSKKQRLENARQLKIARTTIRTRIVTVDREGGGTALPSRGFMGGSRGGSRGGARGGSSRPGSRAGSRACVRMGSRTGSRAASRGDKRVPTPASKSASRCTAAPGNAADASLRWDAPTPPLLPLPMDVAPLTVTALSGGGGGTAPPPARAPGAAAPSIEPATHAPLDVRLPALPGQPQATGSVGLSVASIAAAATSEAEMLAMPHCTTAAAHLAAEAERRVFQKTTGTSTNGITAADAPPPDMSGGAIPHGKEVFSRADMLQAKLAHSRQMYYLQECFQERLVALREHYIARIDSARAGARHARGGGGDDGPVALNGTLDSYTLGGAGHDTGQGASSPSPRGPGPQHQHRALSPRAHRLAPRARGGDRGGAGGVASGMGKDRSRRNKRGGDADGGKGAAEQVQGTSGMFVYPSQTVTGWQGSRLSGPSNGA